jgi:hypothetical protein
MNNEPVAWIKSLSLGTDGGEFKYADDVRNLEVGTPLYTHPAKPAICVGYWDNKTGAFHKNLTEVQQKRLDDGFLKPVYTEGMLPANTLAEDDLMQILYELTALSKEHCEWITKAILRKAQEK